MHKPAFPLCIFALRSYLHWLPMAITWALIWEALAGFSRKEGNFMSVNTMHTDRLDPDCQGAEDVQH